MWPLGICDKRLVVRKSCASVNARSIAITKLYLRVVWDLFAGWHIKTYNQQFNSMYKAANISISKEEGAGSAGPM